MSIIDSMSNAAVLQRYGAGDRDAVDDPCDDVCARYGCLLPRDCPVRVRTGQAQPAAQDDHYGKDTVPPRLRRRWQEADAYDEETRRWMAADWR